MPYSNPKQGLAVFLDIQRKKGQAAAEDFASRHRGDMRRGAKAAAKEKTSKTYRPRSRRSKNG